MNLDYIYIFLPITLGLITAGFCSPKSSNQLSNNVNIKIPNELFMIIWPVLYILIGFSWYLSKNDNMSNLLYLILNILLCSWLIIYSCFNNKNLAFYILLLCLLFSIICYTSSNNKIAKMFMCPLIVWLIVATIISYIK